MGKSTCHTCKDKNSKPQIQVRRHKGQEFWARKGWKACGQKAAPVLKWAGSARILTKGLCKQRAN